MSLEQQTSNFVIHLRGLKASELEKTQLSVNQSRPSLPAVPVYVAAPEAAQLHSDPESDPESPGASQKTPPERPPSICSVGVEEEEEEVIAVVLTFYRTFFISSILCDSLLSRV